MSTTERGSRPADALDPTGTLTELAAIVASVQTLEMVLEDLVGLARDRISGADEVSMTCVLPGSRGPPRNVGTAGKASSQGPSPKVN